MNAFKKVSITEDNVEIITGERRIYAGMKDSHSFSFEDIDDSKTFIDTMPNIEIALHRCESAGL